MWCAIPKKHWLHGVYLRHCRYCECPSQHTKLNLCGLQARWHGNFFSPSFDQHVHDIHNLQRNNNKNVKQQQRQQQQQ